MPAVYTRRRPGKANAFGRQPSLATWRHNRGKPTNDVLADRHSTASTLAMVT